MAINLQKGQRINLRKDNGATLERFCVGCNWGAIEESTGIFGLGKRKVEVDLDLSCVMFDGQGNLCDHIYSPLYKSEFLARYGMPLGKLDSRTGALHHTGDDRSGDVDGDDGEDNEIITVDLTRVGDDVARIFFFLNNCGGEDFSEIPYAAIRMYEGTPDNVLNVYAAYNVAASPEYRGKRAVVMGELYRKEGEWKFSAIGDAFDDANLCVTIARIAQTFVKR